MRICLCLATRALQKALHRLSAAFFLLCVIPATTQAQIVYPDSAPPEVAVLRQMAYHGDIAGAEALMRAGHLASLNAQNYEPLRAIAKAFAVTDPRMLRFTAEWLAAKPQSPYALTARSIALFNLGALIRGNDVARWTWRPALQMFAIRTSQSADLAAQAFALAPDYVPASDALTQALGRTGRTGQIAGVVEQVMQISPNRRSLQKAVGALVPQWGGSLRQMAKLCQRHADTLPDTPGWTADMCMTVGILRNGVRGAEVEWAEGILDMSDHPMLTLARVQDAVENRPATPESRAVLEAYLDDPAVLDLQTAQTFDAYLPRHPGAQARGPKVLARTVAFAQQEITHDPHNPALLSALAGRNVAWPDRVDNPEPLPFAQQQDLIGRALMVAEYSPDLWLRYAYATYFGMKQHQDTAADPWFQNAAIYANYKPAVLWDYIFVKLTAYMNMSNWQNLGLAEMDGQPIDYSRMEVEITCPLIRAVRLIAATCDGLPTRDGGCLSYDGLHEKLQSIIDQSAATGTCQQVRQSPMAGLNYTPTFPPWGVVDLVGGNGP